LLEIENLSTHYVSAHGTRVVRAVDDVSIRVDAGETVGIVGESGSGKSTLALSILRVLPTAAKVASGHIWFEGEDLAHKSDAEMQHVRGKRIAMILQDPMASEPAVHHRQSGFRADPRARRSGPAHRLATRVRFAEIGADSFAGDPRPAVSP
jgi:ABC-type glutathione transport system ATPase component